VSDLANPAFQLVTDVPGTLGVRGVLSFDTATAALQSIRSAMSARGLDRLDLSAVSHSDSAGLACVIAVAAGAANGIKVTGMPDGMRALAQVCEVDRLLG
jgi:phospholipid transport system transporter-binding protein